MGPCILCICVFMSIYDLWVSPSTSMCLPMCLHMPLCVYVSICVCVCVYVCVRGCAACAEDSDPEFYTQGRFRPTAEPGPNDGHHKQILLLKGETPKTPSAHVS